MVIIGLFLHILGFVSKQTIWATSIVKIFFHPFFIYIILIRKKNRILQIYEFSNIQIIVFFNITVVHISQLKQTSNKLKQI